ncbi:T9SS type A sorting domain-containing protein, partial [bacterium]|nr:T9SS type A sorting domain-containing protein [bacterium]
NAVNNNGGIWPNPDNPQENLAVGTVINVTGWVRGGSSGGLVTINPSSLDGIEIAATPPIIENFTRTPAAPTSSQGVDVSGTVRSTSSTIATAQMLYRVDGGAFQTVDLTAGAGDEFTGTIPPQADGSFVEYLFKATDAASIANQLPADTSAATGFKFFYHVRDAGLTVADLQNTPFVGGNSGYVGLEVTVTGVVTTDSTDFSFYYIQDGTGPWTGIQVNDNLSEVGIGDNVTVTGTMEERFGVTRISGNITATVNSTGNALPDPEVLTTSELATVSTGEQWESVLVQVQNVTVTNPRPDGSPGFGEFTINDGSGDLRVDDLSSAFGGQADPNMDLFPEGATIESITAVHYFSFSNYKLAPRNDNDIVGLVVSVEDDDLVPLTFDLEQNYPNPFNPETTIRYQLAQQGQVKIQIFNILGQRVRTLVDQVQPAGTFSVRWDATNDSGARVATGVYVYRMTTPDFVKSQKMLLLK